MAPDPVQVFLRFRPRSTTERNENSPVVIQISDCGSSVIVDKRDGKQGKQYNFDYVFDWTVTQQQVYDVAAKPLVEQVLRGYNATIFAYGQTGSGKTWTMEGKPTPEHKGLIPRMVEAVFDAIEDSDEHLEFLVQISYLEIYMERIKDLLDSNNSNLRIRQNAQKGVFVDNISDPYVYSPEDIFECLEHGQMSRMVTGTSMNSESSRSHAVFVFCLHTTDSRTGSKKMSKLMMVDLAGSEKTRKTQATGQTLEEAKQINKSLSCLGRVINALVSGKVKHIPYRDSKLTYLLSDSLGGNSLTSVIITGSPALSNVEETLSTCRFGTSCKAVKNKPKINKEMSIQEAKIMIKQAKKRNEELEKQIRALQHENKILKKALEDGLDLEAALKQIAEAGIQQQKSPRRPPSPRKDDAGPKKKAKPTFGNKKIGDEPELMLKHGGGHAKGGLAKAKSSKSERQAESKEDEEEPAPESPPANDEPAPDQPPSLQADDYDEDDDGRPILQRQRSASWEARQNQLGVRVEELEGANAEFQLIQKELAEENNSLRIDLKNEQQLQEELKLDNNGLKGQLQQEVKARQGMEMELNNSRTKEQNWVFREQEMAFQSQKFEDEIEELKIQLEKMKKELTHYKTDSRESSVNAPSFPMADSSRDSLSYNVDGKENSELSTAPLIPMNNDHMRNPSAVSTGTEYSEVSLPPVREVPENATEKQKDDTILELQSDVGKLTHKMKDIESSNKKLKKRLWEATLNNATNSSDSKKKSQHAKNTQLVLNYRKLLKRHKSFVDAKEKAERELARIKKKEEYNESLCSNYKEQLTQMEGAVILATQLHNRERTTWNGQLMEKEAELSKLKRYLHQLLQKQNGGRVRPLRGKGGGKRIGIPARPMRGGKGKKPPAAEERGRVISSLSGNQNLPLAAS